MRIIVTGDRRWYDLGLAEGILSRLIARHGGAIVIVHGAATGIDKSFADACGDVGVDQEAHPARWGELYHDDAVIRYDARGRASNAGPTRNQEMVDLGAELCLAIHRAIGSSRGTKDCARRALAAGIPTYLISEAEIRPERIHGDDPRLG